MRKFYGEKLSKWYGENAANWWANPDTGPGPFVVFSEQNFRYLKYCETIHSVRGRKNLKKVNPVYHWKAYAEVYPVIRCTPRWGSQFGTYVESDLDKTPPWSCEEEFSQPYNIATPFVLPIPAFAPDVDTVVNDAIREMVPALNTLVSFVESFDIPSTFDGMLRQGLSGEILRLNLAVLPLIGELEAIAQRLGAWDSLVARVNRDLSRGFRAVTGQSRELTHTHLDQDGVRTSVEYTVTQVYGVRVVGNIPPTTSYLERIGLNSSLGDILWNSLPLSFVIEYFIPIGTFFTRPIVPNFVVTSTWTTTKITGTYVCERFVGDRWIKCQDGWFEQYDRVPRKWDNPDGVVMDTSVLNVPTSWRQWANLVALARLFTSGPRRRMRWDIERSLHSAPPGSITDE